MKKLLNIILLASLVFIGCKKNDKRYPFDVAIERVPYVNVKVDATGSQAIDVLNLANFNGKYTVDLLYPNDVKPDKVDVIVIKNGDKTNQKVLQTNVTTFPSSFTVTAAQLATLFGSTVALGNSFDIGVNIYKNDRVYEAFPLGTQVVAYGGTGQANQPGFQPIANFTAICAYDPAIYEGNFVVISDAFQDFSPGEIVKLTRVSANQFSFIDPYVTNPLPIIVTVDIQNNQISVTKQKIGDKFVWSNTYTNVNATVTKNTTSIVSPCAKTVNIAIAFTADQAPNGFVGSPFLLKLVKQ